MKNRTIGQPKEPEMKENVVEKPVDPIELLSDEDKLLLAKGRCQAVLEIETGKMALIDQQLRKMAANSGILTKKPSPLFPKMSAPSLPIELLNLAPKDHKDHPNNWAKDDPRHKHHIPHAKRPDEEAPVEPGKE